MSGPVVSLDFVAPRVRLTGAGIILLLFGFSSLTAAAYEYHALTTRRAGLELRLAAAVRQAKPDPNATARSSRAVEEAAGVAVELGAPWTALLADLELAGHDSQETVAVLAIEPDQEKRRVRITGESKDLPQALAYLSRLQEGGTLRFPMLESHEVVADDQQHPVRFTLTADWWTAP